MTNEEKKEKVSHICTMTLLIILGLSLIVVIIFAIMSHFAITNGELVEEKSVHKVISIESQAGIVPEYEITYLKDKNGINVIETETISKDFTIIDNTVEKPELVEYRCKLGIFTATQNYIRLTQDDYKILKNKSKLIIE